MENNNNSNNMLNNLLPLLMNRGGNGGGANNNMLTMLLPLLMQKGGKGGSSDILKTLIPAMTGNNPQMAQILQNFGGGKSDNDEPKREEPIDYDPPQYTPPCRNNNKGRHYADYSKLYPDINNLDLHKMPKIDDFKKDEPLQHEESNNSQQSFGNNSLLTLLTLMQSFRNQPNNLTEEKIQAIDGIAPPKIKKSLKAILALNNIIKE